MAREVFARYLDGDAPRQIARKLNERGIVTAQGLRWTPGSVVGVISSRHVTGIRIFRGQDYGNGDWPAIIDRGTWTEAQERRAYRASVHAQRPFRFYVLRGLVMCKTCGKPMGGSANNHKPYYVCTRRDDRDGTSCTRRIAALKLETFVTDAAIELLSKLDVSAAPTATHHGTPGIFDYSRIDIEPNPPNTGHDPRRATRHDSGQPVTTRGYPSQGRDGVAPGFCEGLTGALSCENRWCDGCDGLDRQRVTPVTNGAGTAG